MDKETHGRRWAAMVANWRGDPEFRSQMEEDPKAALAENGIELPGVVEDVRLAVDSEETVHMVFPPDPNGAVSDASLQDVVGGADVITGWWIAGAGWMIGTDVPQSPLAFAFAGELTSG